MVVVIFPAINAPSVLIHLPKGFPDKEGWNKVWYARNGDEMKQGLKDTGGKGKEPNLWINLAGGCYRMARPNESMTELERNLLEPASTSGNEEVKETESPDRRGKHRR